MEQTEFRVLETRLAKFWILQIGHRHNKEESFYKGRLKKSNLDGDTGGENLKEQENNNNIFNKINTTIYNNKHNSTSWG